MLHIGELPQQHYPLNVLGGLLLQHLPLLQTACFEQTRGTLMCPASVLLARRVVVPMNQRLKRSGQHLIVNKIDLAFTSQHELTMHYVRRGCDPASLTVIVFEPSKKALAIERRRELELAQAAERDRAED